MAKPLGAILGRQLRTSGGKADSRRKLIGAVRAAAARMQLTDDDRRAIQAEITGKASLGDMTLGEIGQVLDRLNRDRPAPMAHRAHVGKVKALWWTCYWLGAIDEPNDQALDAFVARQTGVASIRFLDHRKAPAVIEALKAMAARAGVRWQSGPAAGETRAPDAIERATIDRRCVIEALWARLRELTTLQDGDPWRYLAAAIGGGADPCQLGAHELDELIKLLGKRLRRLMAKSVA